MSDKEFIITTNYCDVLAEAEAKAKYNDMSSNSKLSEYRKRCRSLHNNGNRSDLEKSILRMKDFKAKELIDINGIRKN